MLIELFGGGYCEQLKPLFLTDEETHNFRAYIIDYIRENYGFTSWITTRFDNDDAIRFDYIEKIQKCYDKNKGEYAISFSDGYQYDAGKNVLSKYHFPNNHFTTFVTDLRDKTIYDFGHINLVNQNRMIYLDEGIAMWVEVIHGNNVYNRMGTINPFNYIKFKNLNEEFGIDVKVQRSILELIWFYFYFAIRKAWNKRDRMWIYFCRKLHIKYKDNRTDR